MPLPTRHVIGLMVDNLRKRKSVFPIPRRKAVRWAKALDIPEGGETVLYTGHMYQLLPYMIAAVRRMGGMEDSFLGRFVGMGRFFNRMVNVSSFISRPKRADVKRCQQLLRNIAGLLQQAGVEFGYLYKAELYSGALAYDVGADDVFHAHAQRVYDMLKEHGVRSLITVDPHTTNMMRSVYPTIIDGYDLEVKSYLEVLAASDIRPQHRVDRSITVHDSCVYARYEGVIDEPRDLLRRAGYEIREPKNNRELTHCCGGPVESLFPSVAHKVGLKRTKQLQQANGASVATMCPICMATLEMASDNGLQIDDISSYLVRAYGGGTQQPAVDESTDDERSEP